MRSDGTAEIALNRRSITRSVMTTLVGRVFDAVRKDGARVENRVGGVRRKGSRRGGDGARRL
jgi:hypothetical protein